MKDTKVEWKKIKKIIACMVFLALIIQVFFSVTYLFRNATHNRTHIAGLAQEDTALDMIYVGGSATFVYWQPLKAWNDCGYTSYSYATDAVSAESIEYYVKEIQKTQSPSLYVIDVRPFEYWTAEPNTEDVAGLRNGTDSMDFLSSNRWELVNKFLEYRVVPEESGDELSFYLDIAKYHNNVTNLASPTAWDLIDNEIEQPNKGWEWIDEYKYLPENNPASFQTDEKVAIGDTPELLLRSLLEYCKEENLNVLFVVCPYAITKAEYAEYNTIADIISEYGFDYINTNDYYEEMEIDFNMDFYNVNHVNVFGAEKYTAFLEEYIDSKYDLPNHKGEEGYDSWDEDYARFKEEETYYKASIDAKRKK